MSGNKPDVEKLLYWRRDSGRGGDEWDIGAGVLPAATFEANAVLLVAADADVRGSGTGVERPVERERGTLPW
jgi:hypothetical protein